MEKAVQEINQKKAAGEPLKPKLIIEKPNYSAPIEPAEEEDNGPMGIL